jgi:hypothetical protein
VPGASPAPTAPATTRSRATTKPFSHPTKSSKLMLDKIKFSFLSAVNRAFMFTGRTEAPTEKFDITANVHDIIIGMYLKKPGIITSPDGSEFLLELSLLPASREAKQKAINDAQALINSNNRLDEPEPPKGSKEWLETAWARNLSASDKALFERIAKVRANGQRVTFQYSNPTQFKVLISPAPKKAKPVKAAEVVAAPQQAPAAVERIAVVVVTIPESNSETFIIERSEWNHFATAHAQDGRTWDEDAKAGFCAEYNISPDDISNIDYEQTRTREELDNLPDFQF